MVKEQLLNLQDKKITKPRKKRAEASSTETKAKKTTSKKVPKDK